MLHNGLQTLLSTPLIYIHPSLGHVRSIFFDLYTQEGLGHVADLIGSPIEVDEFTRTMSILEVAHLKVKVDCTKTLPSSAEIERENGEIVRFSIDYPWTPLICPSCKELGHLETMCPNAKWSPKSHQEKDNQCPSSPTSPKTSATSPISGSLSAPYALQPSHISISPDGIMLPHSEMGSSSVAKDHITHLVALPYSLLLQAKTNHGY